jgi:hypothetical protein
VPAISTWNFHVASHPILVINGARGTGVWKVVAAAVLTSDSTRVQQVYRTSTLLRKEGVERQHEVW